jgi:antitoxin ChpS
MLTTTLRKVGGSVMLAVPRSILDMMRLEAGAAVQLALEGDKLVIQPQHKPRYTLDELLAQCDAGAPLAEEERAWQDAPPVGRELV